MLCYQAPKPLSCFIELARPLPRAKLGKEGKVKPELDSGGDLIQGCINYTDIKCLVCKIISAFMNYIIMNR